MSQQKVPISRTLPLLVDAYIRKQLDKLGRSLPCQVVEVDPTNTIVTVSFQVTDVQMPQATLPVGTAEYIRLPIQVGSLGVCFPVDTYTGQVTGLGTGTASLARRANLSTLVFFPTGNANLSATDDANALVMYGPNGVILRDINSKSVITLTPANIDLNAQTNLTAEAGSEIQLTVGSNSVLLNGTEIELTVGSNTVLLNSTQAEVTIGSTTFLVNGTSIVMTAGGITATLNSSGFTVTGKIIAPSAAISGAVTANSVAISGLVTANNITLAGNMSSSTADIGGIPFSNHKHSGVTTGGSNTGNPV